MKKILFIVSAILFISSNVLSQSDCIKCPEIKKSFCDSLLLFKANLCKCNIDTSQDRSRLGCGDIEFVTDFGGNDFFCEPLSGGGIEVSPGIPGVKINPAFTNSTPPIGQLGPVPLGSPFDHIKFLAYSYYAEAPVNGGELCVTWVGSGKQLNVNNHPFGNAVKNPEEDLRLASTGLITLDPGTSIINDFFITNKIVYALVERLPLREDCFGVYASYAYFIPVLKINPNQDPLNDIHKYQICYNRRDGIITFKIDGCPVLQVTQIGRKLTSQNSFIFPNGVKTPLSDPKRFLLIDHGGEEQDVRPVGFQSGMGLFTLLDGYLPNNVCGVENEALVRLESRRFREGSNTVLFDQDPITGGEATFQQDCPLNQQGTEYAPPCIDSSFRVFGQGALLRLFDYRLTIEPNVS